MRKTTLSLHTSQSGKNPRTRLRVRCCLLVGILLPLFSVSCSTETTSTTSAELRLLLTPFRGKSFGASLQIPIIIAAEVTGRVRSRLCLLLQVDHSTTTQIQLSYQKGKVITETDPDVSEAVFRQYEACKQAKRPCLVGQFDTRRTEFIAQVELLTPSAGGLVVGGLFNGDCSADDTFDATNIIAREAIAVGFEFRSQNTETTTSSSDGGSTESTSETTAGEE